MRHSLFHHTPTWLLLMPSLVVGVFIGTMDDSDSTASFSSATESTPAIAFSTPAMASEAPQSTAAPRNTAAPQNTATPLIKTSLSPAYTPPPRARYEPARGVYLGAALDASQLQGVDQRALAASQIEKWEKQSGRKHALYLGFTQFPYEDGAFPTWDSDPRGWLTAKAFCEAVASRGATPILTLEPFGNPLQFSRDWKAGSAAYVATEKFARAAGAWNKPLFVRFAHEMNGSWYPWAEWTDKNKNLRRDADEDTGFSAAEYRRAYRNVASMFRRFAPRAALVWCPNSGLLGGERRDVFRPFYPGDDVVDWVALDSYEKGWSMPMPGAKLWGGQFAHTMTHDMADDPATTANESVDFYKTFAQGKNKPMLLCETAATLSYRNDLEADARGLINNQWKSGYWNPSEYGWMQAVYGTSIYSQSANRGLLQPIDTRFPKLKGIVWFQIAKNEWIPVEKTVGTSRQIVWFDDAPTDYRIGGGIDQSDSPFSRQELDLYRAMTANSYFLGNLAR